MTQDKRTRRIVYLLLSVTVMAVLGTALFVRWIVDVDSLRPHAVETLTRITGRPVSLDKISFAPTEGFFALELHNLQIHATTPSEPPILIARKVQVGITPAFFFYDRDDTRLEISSLTFTNPQINIIQRSDFWLARLLQDTVEISDQRMKQQLGWGLTNLAVDTIKIQNGIVTLLDWERAIGRTLVLDRIHASIRDFSAKHPSPASLSARFQSVPFTLSGQVGPLPPSLDLTELPVLLNLEAKSTSLLQFVDFFANFSNLFIANAHAVQLPKDVDIRGARGYFSTLFKGTLSKGLQTRSRLELDKLTLTTTHPEKTVAHSGGSSPDQQTLPLLDPLDQPDPVQQTVGIPGNLAIRQTSLLRIEENQPVLNIEECFFYMDGKPILDIKGALHGMGQTPEMNNRVDLTVTTLNSFDLKRFPETFIPFLSGDIPQGTVQFQGNWPAFFQWRAHLDFSQTALSFPSASLQPPTADQKPPQVNPMGSERYDNHPLLSLLHTLGIEKEAGVPLVLDLEMSREEGQDDEDLWLLKELMVSRPSIPLSEIPAYQMRWSGTLEPITKLEMRGEWELSLLKAYLTKAVPWNLSGIAQAKGLLTFDRQTTGAHKNRTIHTLDGQLRMETGRLAGIDVQDFFVRIQQDQALLRLAEMESNTGLGRLDGHLLVDFSKPKTTYRGVFAFAGIALEKLAEASQSGRVGLSTTRQVSKKPAVGSVIPPTADKKPLSSYPLVEGIAFGSGELYGQLDHHWLPEHPFAGTLHLEIEPGRMLDVDGDLFLRPPVTSQVIFGPEKRVSTEVTGQTTQTIHNSGLARKAFYWDYLVADLLWDHSVLYFNNMHIDSNGLQLTGTGAWDPDGPQRFKLTIQSPLIGSTAPFDAWLEGNAERILYRPKKEWSDQTP